MTCFQHLLKQKDKRAQIHLRVSSLYCTRICLRNIHWEWKEFLENFVRNSLESSHIQRVNVTLQLQDPESMNQKAKVCSNIREKTAALNMMVHPFACRFQLNSRKVYICRLIQRPTSCWDTPPQFQYCPTDCISTKSSALWKWGRTASETSTQIMSNQRSELLCKKFAIKIFSPSPSSSSLCSFYVKPLTISSTSQPITSFVSNALGRKLIRQHGTNSLNFSVHYLGSDVNIKIQGKRHGQYLVGGRNVDW